MRRFRIHHEKRDKQNRIVLSLFVILLSVSIVANMDVTGFASQPKQLSYQELLDVAMQSAHAKRFAAENDYRAEVIKLDSVVLSGDESYTGVPEGSYEVRFISDSKNKPVAVIIYNMELFRTVIG